MVESERGGLARRLKIVVDPVGSARGHRVGADHSRFDVVALAALEIAEIVAAGAWHDPSEAHAGLAVRTARTLYRRKRRSGRIGMRLRHVMHPCVKAGACSTLSHR
jgi:hypothetical protein